MYFGDDSIQPTNSTLQIIFILVQLNDGIVRQTALDNAIEDARKKSNIFPDEEVVHNKEFGLTLW
jgi:hypothetical protein